MFLSERKDKDKDKDKDKLYLAVAVARSRKTDLDDHTYNTYNTYNIHWGDRSDQAAKKKKGGGGVDSEIYNIWGHVQEKKKGFCPQ